MLSRFVFAAVFALACAGCAAQPAPRADAQQAPLRIERFLAGRTLADGVFRNTLTGGERGLTAVLNGTWNGRTLVLREDVRFADGARDRKTWRLTRNRDGSWTGTREDVIGTATGREEGGAFYLSYDASLASQGADLVVHFEDVLMLTGPRTVLNRAVVSKFGLRVGEVTLNIRR